MEDSKDIYHETENNLSEPKYLSAQWFDNITKKAILNGFIQLYYLAHMMALEENYSEILPSLWGFYQCDVKGLKRRTKADLTGHDIENYKNRVVMWDRLLQRWGGIKVHPALTKGRVDTIKYLNLYREDSISGELKRVDSNQTESDLVKLDEFEEYLKNIEKALQIDFPLPKRLFPINDKDAVSIKEPYSKNTFRLEGDFWTISYEGMLIRLKNAKGLHYIAYLLKNPNRDVKANELVRIMETPYEDLRAKELDKMGGTYLEEQSFRKASGFGDSGNLLDSKAIEEYKKRLKEIEEELLEEVLSDEARFKLREEKEEIEDELKAGFDRRGRPRKLGDVEEKIRKAVTNRVQYSLRTIIKEHPALGKHLSDTLKTGATCSYTPATDIFWNT